MPWESSIGSSPKLRPYDNNPRINDAAVDTSRYISANSAFARPSWSTLDAVNVTDMRSTP